MTPKPKHDPLEYRHADLGLSRRELMRIADEAGADSRSVIRLLRHRLGQFERGVRPELAARIEPVLARHGLLPASTGGTVAAE